MHGDKFRSPISETWTKKRYFQIGDLKSVQKLIHSDQRSEHSKACWHDGMCLWRPQTHAVMAANLLTISILTVYHGLRAVGQVCRLGLVDSLQYAYISTVMLHPYMGVCLSSRNSIKYTNRNRKPKPNPNHKP